MATGDVTVSIAVEGGVTKSATFDSATRVKAKLYVDASADADWQVLMVNKSAATIVNQANKQLEGEVSYTPKSFTAST
jgi:isoaspartyl peptidase/L-asparaginase-like protein (Ntn-hydrolase superfamily)